MHEFFLALPVLLFSMVAHEYAHGYAALKQGDRTALELGRLTFNPVKHVDIWFTFLMPAMLFLATGGRVLFGGAKPVPVNPHNYRNYRRGDLIVSSAGIVTNVILVPVCLAAAVSVGMVAQGAAGGSAVLAAIQRMFFWGVWLNLLLAFFNLIPIPPLDGSHLLYHALPVEWRARFQALSRWGFLILFGIIFFAPRALYMLLTPAFALQRLACHVAAPYTLKSFPLCNL